MGEYQYDSHSPWRVLSFSLLILFFCSSLYSQTLSLREVLTLGNAQNEVSLGYEQTRLQLKGQQLQESRLQHEVRSTLSGARNEVEDTQDLSVSASATQQLNLSYKQQFMNGFYWSTSALRRLEQPLASSQEEQEFDKITLSSGIPLYGKSAEQGAFKAEQSHFALSMENQKWEQKKVQMEIALAKGFLDLFLRHESWIEAQERLKLMEQKKTQKKKIPDQQTFLDQTQLQFEFMQLQQEVQSQQDALEHSRKQLAALLRLPPESSQSLLLTRIPSLAHTPERYNLEDLNSLYQENSPQLKQLKYKLQIKQKSRHLAVLATHPDISLSGFLGQSKSSSSTGSNLGVNLSMSYRFGGGISYEEQIAQQEIFQNQDEIKLEQEKTGLQALADIQKQEENYSRLHFAKKRMELSLLKLKIVRQQFKVGTIPLDAQINTETQVLKSKTALQRAKAELWSHYLKMMQRAQLSLLEHLPSTE